MLHASTTHGTWLLYQICIKSTHSSLIYHNKPATCVKKWPQLLQVDTEPNAILQAWATDGTWLLCEIWTTSPHSSLIFHNKHPTFMNKLPQLLKFGRAKFYLCATATHGTWSWYQIWRKSIQPSWRNVCQFHYHGARNNKHSDWVWPGLSVVSTIDDHWNHWRLLAPWRPMPTLYWWHIIPIKYSLSPSSFHEWSFNPLYKAISS